MNCIKSIDEIAACRAPVSIGLAKKESDCLALNRRGGRRNATGSALTVARLVAMSALLFSPCAQAHAGLFKPDVDYSNYDVPLWDQVVNRIKAKAAARLGEGENTVDRYFIVPFAYQHRENKLALAHSFISVIRVFANDRLTREDRIAINCFHAMAGLEELYPNGGFLGTGFRMWGIDDTARVLIEYTKAVRDKGLILEPVDIKRDLYGFVYAPKRNSGGVYNPFPNASAYHE